MKQGIHPKYYPNATVVCACGNTWQTGSTSEFIQTDVCSKCHPFYTGEQRIVDAEGQVDRFYKRLQAREEYISEQKERDAAQTSLDLSILELELGKRTEGTLTQAGIEAVGQIIEKLALGDSALLEIDGFGRKSLADVKRSLKHRGYRLPEEAEKEAS